MCWNGNLLQKEKMDIGVIMKKVIKTDKAPKAEYVQPTDETLLTEYAMAQEDYIHNDSLPWQIGAILIARISYSGACFLTSNSNHRFLSLVPSCLPY